MDLAALTPQHRADPQRETHLPPRSILVVIDPTTHAQPALDKAVRIASQCGSRLELYVCDVEQQIPESWAGAARSDEYRALRRQRLLEHLAALAQPLRERGLVVDLACEWHAPLEQGIGEHAIRVQPDLLVKHSFRHAQQPRAGLGATDWNLIRTVPMPLLLVHERPWPVALRIAAAIDPCRPADRPVALDAAMVCGADALSREFKGKLDIFHVLQMPPHLPGEHVPPQQITAAHAQAREAVTQLARATTASTHFIDGLVTEGLARLAEQHQPDVLVVGALARPRSVHAAAGGTAARVLENVACDVLVMKPPGFVSPLLVTVE